MDSNRRRTLPTTDDLVTLAAQLDSARELVKGRAYDRLRSIAQQMEHLHMAARYVLEDASRDEELHQVACNLQKKPGKIYHLYEQSDGHRYFSLLAPDEWKCGKKLKEFIASYRLESDRSWTPVNEIEQRDKQFSHLDKIQNSGPRLSMLSLEKFHQA